MEACDIIPPKFLPSYKNNIFGYVRIAKWLDHFLTYDALLDTTLKIWKWNLVGEIQAVFLLY